MFLSVWWKLDFINYLTQEGNLKVWLLIVPNPSTTLLSCNPLKDVRPLVRQNDNLVINVFLVVLTRLLNFTRATLDRFSTRWQFLTLCPDSDQSPLYGRVTKKYDIYWNNNKKNPGNFGKIERLLVQFFFLWSKFFSFHDWTQFFFDITFT